MGQLLSTLREQIQRFRMQTLSNPSRMRVALEEHRALVEALVARDAEAAARFAAQHIESAENSLMQLSFEERQARRSKRGRQREERSHLMKVEAVVLAGAKNRGKLHEVSDAPHEALIPIVGRPMVHHVLDALKASAFVDRIILVALRKYWQATLHPKGSTWYRRESPWFKTCAWALRVFARTRGADRHFRHSAHQRRGHRLLPVPL